MKPNPRSEGELFLENFFNNQKIKFNSEKLIRNLKNDDLDYRIADFYLPRYKIYVEFQGRWNNTKEDRERYKEKMRVYGKNEVPCLYLYPENLGIIDYVFHARMLDTLKKFGMNSELWKYKFFRFLRNKRTMLLFFIYLVYSLFMSYEGAVLVEGSLEETIYFLTFFVVLYLSIALSTSFYKYVVKEK